MCCPDAYEALILAATHQGLTRIFNIGSGEGRSLNDIVAEIAKLLKTDVLVERRPARSVDVPVSILDTTLASKDLIWQPSTTFEAGLHNTIAWMSSIDGGAVG